MTWYPAHFDYEEPDRGGPLLRCQNPACREEFVADTTTEYQGVSPHGGPVTFLDDEMICEYCETEAKPVRGEEDGYSFEESEYDDSEALYAALDGLDDLIHSMRRLGATTQRGLDATAKKWIESATKRVEQRYEYAIEKAKEARE